MVILGSHKSKIIHPEFGQVAMRTETGTSLDGITGAVEVCLNVGGAILLIDAIMRGSASQVNEGQRRVAVYRYGLRWGFFRHPHWPSAVLLDRLMPERRNIVPPHEESQLPV